MSSAGPAQITINVAAAPRSADITGNSRSKSAEPGAIAPSPAVTARLSTVWPGKNSFFCGGLLLIGPVADYCPLITGWLGLLLAGLVYFGCVAPYLWLHVSKAWVTVGIVLWVSDVYLYARACFSDPGIIPRRRIADALAKADPEWWRRQRQALTEARARGDNYQRRSLPAEDTKNCTTCDCERPLLSGHCWQCDNCVEVFDHHCNFIANCVGQRNHRLFVSFVVCSTAVGWYFMVCGIVQLAAEGAVSPTLADVGSIVLIVSMFCTSCFLTNMSSLHLDLVSYGETLKMHSNGRVKPFDDSCCQKRMANLCSFFCCYSSRPSLIRPRLVVIV